MNQCEDCGVSFNDLDEELTHVAFCPSIELCVEKAVREEREAIIRLISDVKLPSKLHYIEAIRRGEHHVTRR